MWQGSSVVTRTARSIALVPVEPDPGESVNATGPQPVQEDQGGKRRAAKEPAAAAGGISPRISEAVQVSQVLQVGIQGILGGKSRRLPGISCICEVEGDRACRGGEIHTLRLVFQESALNFHPGHFLVIGEVESEARKAEIEREAGPSADVRPTDRVSKRDRHATPSSRVYPHSSNFFSFHTFAMQPENMLRGRGRDGSGRSTPSPLKVREITIRHRR